MEVFNFDEEDHTLGSLLQQELLENKNVIFAGYIAPHPLEKKINVKIQTRKEIKIDKESGESIEVYIEPKLILKNAIENIKSKLSKISDEFDRVVIND